MPLAPPVRTGGAEVMMALLFGVLKKPKPMPHTVIRQTMSQVAGSSGSSAIAARPPAITTMPQPPSSPAG